MEELKFLGEKRKIKKKKKINFKDIFFSKYKILLFFFFWILILIIYFAYMLIMGKQFDFLNAEDFPPFITEKYNDNFNQKIDLSDIIKYQSLSINGILINNPKTVKSNNNPKISIVISVYNGEGFLVPAVRSIQNQNFKDFEIIIVDDRSEDKSIEVVEKLMKEDSRIKLVKNKKNRGAFYTKGRGVLEAKGKYLMTLDVDDLYASELAFSTLYEVSEKEDLDILGFGSILSSSKVSLEYLQPYNFYIVPKIFQPNVTDRMYYHRPNEKIQAIGNVIWCYLFRTDLFKRVVNEVANKYYERVIIMHDDLMYFFLITRRARNFMQIKKFFYLYTYRKTTYNPLIFYFVTQRRKIRKNLNCFSNVNYIEYVFDYTENTYYDKEIAYFVLDRYLISNECKKNKYIKEYAFKVCNLFLECKYITDLNKIIIRQFLKDSKKYFNAEEWKFF